MLAIYYHVGRTPLTLHQKELFYFLKSSTLMVDVILLLRKKGCIYSTVTLCRNAFIQRCTRSLWKWPTT